MEMTPFVAVPGIFVITPTGPSMTTLPSAGWTRNRLVALTGDVIISHLDIICTPMCIHI